MKQTPPDLWRGIAKNLALLTLTFVGASLLKNGPVFWSDWHRPYILPAFLFLILASAVIWLRWEWAPFEARRRQNEREARKSVRD